MSPASILFFTDPHNSDTPPRMRRDSYREDILKKQEFLIEPAKKADVVIIGGDILHQKKPHKISYYLVNRIMEIYREYGVVWIVPGNHDFDMRPEDIKDNPLGVVGKLPNVSIFHNTWLHDVYGMDVFFKGLGSFEEDKSLMDSLKEWQKTQGSLFTLAVIHDAVTTKKYPFPVIDFADIAPFAELFMFGHLHDWQHIDNRIIAPGALSRGVLKGDNVDRDVGYAWVTVDTDEHKVSVKWYKIPMKPALDIFKLEQRQVEVDLEQRVDELLSYLEEFEVGFSASSRESVIAKIEKMDIPKKVKNKAMEIIEQV